MRAHGEAQELKAMGVIEGPQPYATLEVDQMSDNRDRDELARLGKKPVLRVGFPSSLQHVKAR